LRGEPWKCGKRSRWISDALSVARIAEALHPWTLQSLAERVGMSRSVFALRFRETVGATPMEYLARWRMLLAADRLKNSSDGLSAIAQSLGYESESAFGKAFRRVMGCSPRQYTRSTAPRAISVKQALRITNENLL
jgi:AraC-like DNA-binding protein